MVLIYWWELVPSLNTLGPHAEGIQLSKSVELLSLRVACRQGPGILFCVFSFEK